MEKYYIYNKRLNTIYILKALDIFIEEEIELSYIDLQTYILSDPSIKIVNLTKTPSEIIELHQITH